MWLQLVVLLLCVQVHVANAQSAEEEPEVEGRLRVYTDDDHVTVVSPAARSRFAPSESVLVDVGVIVDAVTAASVDIISSASPSPMRELRVEGSGVATWAVEERWRLRSGGTVSYESDYVSLQPLVGAQVEVAQRNATIDLSYTRVLDEAGRSDEPSFARKRRGHILATAFTQIVDSNTYADVLLEGRALRGYHANPYRLVPLRSRDSPVLAFAEERTPTLRRSAAAMIRIRRAIGGSPSWFVHGSYRFYADTWSIASHTLSARLFHPLARERFLLGGHLRAYTQSAADFYRAYYESPDGMSVPEFRTRDRTLGGMQSLHGSVTADTAVGPAKVRTSMSLTEFRFENFPAQSARRALTVELSLRTSW